MFYLKPPPPPPAPPVPPPNENDILSEMVYKMKRQETPSWKIFTRFPKNVRFGE